MAPAMLIGVMTDGGDIARYEQDVLVCLRDRLLDDDRPRGRGVRVSDVRVEQTYPSTCVRLTFRSRRHPGVDQTSEAGLWNDQGEPVTWTRRRELGAQLPDPAWHASQIEHGFLDNWLDLDDRT